MGRLDKNLKLNPRRWPRGRDYYNDLSSNIGEELCQAGVPLLSDSEVNFIHDVPRILGNGHYANLGHSGGGSAILMGDCIRELKLDARVYSVDIFPSAKEHRVAARNLERWPGAAANIQLCVGSTDHWAAVFKVRSWEMTAPKDPSYFKFVFVDADHSYPSVKQDAINWMPLVEPGGWMSFHDTNQEFSHNAIEESIAKVWPEVKEYHVDRIRTFQRPI